MDGAIWLTILAIGLVQGAFLCLALMLKRTGNPPATRALARLAGAFTLGFAAAFGMTYASPERFLWAVAPAINLELAFGPLLFLFVRALARPEQGGRRDLVHATPIAVGLVGWLLLAWTTGGAIDAVGIDRYIALVAVYMPIKTAITIGYLVAARRVLGRLRRDGAYLAAGRRRVPVAWVDRAVRALIALAILLLALHMLGLAGVPWPASPDAITSLALAALVYALSMFVLLVPSLLSARPRAAADAALADDAARLRELFATERPYLDAELTLGQLATRLGMTENRVSAVINDGLRTSFYALIARHRLRHFERLARDRANRRRSVLDLAMDAGWNSKAAFYRAFRDAHGTTPAAFRRACSA